MTHPASAASAVAIAFTSIVLKPIIRPNKVATGLARAAVRWAVTVTFHAASGEGDIAVANTYYFARMASGSPEDQEVASAVGVVFPNQAGRGTHVNISGAGVVRGAPNRDNAIRFLEYLTGPEAQTILPGGNKEYPVAGGSESVVELAEYGPFREDTLNASVFGANNQTALMTMDRCGWR